MIRRYILLGVVAAVAGCGGGDGAQAADESRRAANAAAETRAAERTSGALSENDGVADRADGAASLDGSAAGDQALAGPAPSGAADAGDRSAGSAGSAGSRAGGTSAEPTRSGARDESAASPAGGDPEAVDVLRRAERAYADLRSLEAEFQQQVTVPVLGSTQRSSGTMYHRRPDRFLMRFSDPEGDIVVADGRHLWMYYPSVDEDQVMRTSLGSGQEVDLQRELLSNASERFEVRDFRDATVAGRPAWELALVPREAAPYRSVRVWVDKRDALVRRFEVVEENESVRRLELRNLKPNASLPDGLFSFTPPPGARVFDQ